MNLFIKMKKLIKSLTFLFIFGFIFSGKCNIKIFTTSQYN